MDNALALWVLVLLGTLSADCFEGCETEGDHLVINHIYSWDLGHAHINY
jgi:hypothetical protein